MLVNFPSGVVWREANFFLVGGGGGGVPLGPWETLAYTKRE